MTSGRLSDFPGSVSSFTLVDVLFSELLEVLVSLTGMGILYWMSYGLQSIGAILGNREVSVYFSLSAPVF